VQDNWSWDYNFCDYPDCGELATYTLYVGDVIRRHVCQVHHDELASERAWYWRDIQSIVAAIDAELPN
jgi:hypothetical protein